MIVCVCPNLSIDSFFEMVHFRESQVNRSQKEAYYPGGKGVHVALAAKELGEDVALLGFWGGVTGQWIKKKCEQFGIMCFGPVINQNSRFNIIFKSQKSRIDETQILAAGPQIDKVSFAAFKEDFKKIIEDAKCIVMSGSWPNSQTEDEYQHLIEISGEYQKPVFIDFTGQQLTNVLYSKPYGLHLNLDEAQEYFGKTSTELQLIQKMNNVSTLPMLTLGSEGLCLGRENQYVTGSCKIEEDEVVSTVGSGDCTVAGLAVSYVRNYNLYQTVTLAVACGAANCLRSELGMLYKKDVDSLLSKVSVNEVNP